MGLIPNFIGAIVFTAVQFIVFVFVLVGTPLPQFRSKRAGIITVSTCKTLWGTTSKCNGVKYDAKGTKAFTCKRRSSTMQCGAAFSIISIFTTLVALVFGVLMIIKIPCAVVMPLIFTALSVITILICWACVAGVMTEKMCEVTVGSMTVYPAASYDITYHYGAGFGLMVTAWCLEVVDLVLLIVLACL